MSADPRRSIVSQEGAPARPGAGVPDLRELGVPHEAHILIGIRTFNDAETIGEVIEAARAGLATYFPSATHLIVVSDSGSTDGTLERIARMREAEPPVVLVTGPAPATAQPLPSRGRALDMLFRLARASGARACVVLDADHQRLAPERIDLLVAPIMEKGFDLVAPYYARRKEEGALVKAILYPLIRALYGRQIREPLGDDFGFSRRLVEFCLDQDAWRGLTDGFGADLWMVTEAICGGFRLSEAAIGPRARKCALPDVSATLAQVVGVVFSGMERHAGEWQRVRGSEPVPFFSRYPEEAAPGEPVSVTPMIDAFRLGYRELREVWSAVLPPSTLVELKKLAASPDETFSFDDRLWARTIYDFAVGHRLRAMDRDHLLRSLTPLYLGCVASFLRQIETTDAAAAEDRLERMCAAFEVEKPYLISRWRWPESRGR